MAWWRWTRGLQVCPSFETAVRSIVSTVDRNGLQLLISKDHLGSSFPRVPRNVFLIRGTYNKRCIMDGPKMGAKTSLSLVPLVTNEEHLAWAKKIKPHVPHNIMMHNCLMQHGVSHVYHDTFYVLHDRPSSHAIVCVKKMSQAWQNVILFCLEEEVDQLISVLASTVITECRSTLVHYIPPYLLVPLQQLAEKKGAKVSCASYMAFMYHIHLDTEPLRISQGFRVCRLGRAGVRQLFEKDLYPDGISLELMYSLAQRLPYLGVYQDLTVTQDTIVDVSNLPVAGDEEIPVSWACSTPNGEVGKTITEEGFKRRGFYSLLIKTVAKCQAALGFIPNAFVEASKLAPLAMAEKNPCWKYTHDAFWMSIIKPEK